MLTLRIENQRFPITGSFTDLSDRKGNVSPVIEVVVATLDDTRHIGRGECVPYARYGETIDSVTDQLDRQARALADDEDIDELIAAMTAGAARNALDCAAWDLRARQNGTRVWQLAGLPEPGAAVSCFTISAGTPDAMFEAARNAGHRPILKAELGGDSDGDGERIHAVRRGAPEARLLVDANESWSPDSFMANLQACQRARVELIEQPLPADADDMLRNFKSPITLCADESLRERASLNSLASGYRAINIKLDKTGGLTEAIVIARHARARGLDIMVGCVPGTSLAMAPAMLLTPGCAFVDLDGPHRLDKDREPGLRYEGSTIYPPASSFWG